MSRKHRIWYPGATYHITARGNRRAALFLEDEDYHMYLSILEDVRGFYPFILHSYCLMTNHIHLQIETIRHHIKDIMKELHSRYAVYLNKKLKVDGHVFQGRYGAELIETAEYFLEVSRYIHRNPLEAHMVNHLIEYPWSSYPSYVHYTNNPHIDSTKTYSFFFEPVHLRYQKFVEKLNKTSVKESH
ncbi:transposase [Bacillus carboniphilus]|uniref:Transposase n=1 Tax=Bacillus carboniphilus TaxID=86663 RepID=A0ABN0VWL9_9BACI